MKDTAPHIDHNREEYKKLKGAEKVLKKIQKLGEMAKDIITGDFDELKDDIIDYKVVGDEVTEEKASVTAVAVVEVVKESTEAAQDIGAIALTLVDGFQPQDITVISEKGQSLIKNIGEATNAGKKLTVAIKAETATNDNSHTENISVLVEPHTSTSEVA